MNYPEPWPVDEQEWKRLRVVDLCRAMAAKAEVLASTERLTADEQCAYEMIADWSSEIHRMSLRKDLQACF